jgi:hypothetical protein
MRTSESLQVGKVYSRQVLRDKFGIQDATLNNGVFRPKGHDSVWLFITETKTPDRTQYRDALNGDELEWDGQNSGRTDRLIIDHDVSGLELLVFYRRQKYEYENAGFRYEGPFQYVSHSGTNPSHFLLRRVGGDKTQLDTGDVAVQAVEEAQNRSRGQGFAVTPEARRVIELHAMTRATEFMQAEGYHVRDVSSRQPYDLECRRASERVYVEVKGTQGDGSAILLTPNEVAFAREHKSEMALFVLHSVEVSSSEMRPKASGGVIRVIRPWDVDEGQLMALGYSCTLPP